MPFAKINGRSLHYTDFPASSPSSSATTIIFVHGLGSTQNFYSPIIPTLSSYRCITFDNYGAGRSTFLPDQFPTTSVEDIGRDVMGLLDFLAVKEAICVGYSMGGMVPSWLASDANPDGKSRVKAGVLIGPVHPGEVVAEVFKKRVPIVEKDGMDPLATSIPTAATNPTSTPLQRAFIREMLLSQSPAGYIANCNAITNATAPPYATVTCPMLVIAGSLDQSAPLERCKTIYGDLGGEKELKVMEGVGHWFCVEDAEGTAGLVKGFVDGLE